MGAWVGAWVGGWVGGWGVRACMWVWVWVWVCCLPIVITTPYCNMSSIKDSNVFDEPLDDDELKDTNGGCGRLLPPLFENTILSLFSNSDKLSAMKFSKAAYNAFLEDSLVLASLVGMASYLKVEYESNHVRYVEPLHTFRFPDVSR